MWGPGDPEGASWAIGCSGTVAPVSGWGLWQVQKVRENVPVSSGVAPAASGRGTGSTAAMRGCGMDIQPHCAGEHGPAAAASGAPLEPIHDLLMSETQLRSSPRGTGRSLLGLEKDVVGAPAPRRAGGGGGGDVPGGRGREMGQLRGGSAEPPPRRTGGAWKGSGQQLQGWCGVAGCGTSSGCTTGPRQSPPLGCGG